MMKFIAYGIVCGFLLSVAIENIDSPSILASVSFFIGWMAHFFFYRGK